MCWLTGSMTSPGSGARSISMWLLSLFPGGCTPLLLCLSMNLSNNFLIISFFGR